MEALSIVSPKSRIQSFANCRNGYPLLQKFEAKSFLLTFLRKKSKSLCGLSTYKTKSLKNKWISFHKSYANFWLQRDLTTIQALLIYKVDHCVRRHKLNALTRLNCFTNRR